MEEINIIMLKNFWFIHLISAKEFFPLINSIVSEFKYNTMYLNLYDISISEINIS